MSCYTIFYKDGTKMMRPVTSREEYLSLRNSEKQKAIVNGVRRGEKHLKLRLLQMNYSCLPNEDGTLRCSTEMTNSVGMDVDLHRDDFANEEEYQMSLVAIPEKVLSKKEELGLLMLERSATKGYHLVFRRNPEMTQEENLRWASHLLGVEFDQGAKDITRVFFTTTASTEDLIYLDDELFNQEACAQCVATQQDAELQPKDSSARSPIASASHIEAEERSLRAFDLCVQNVGLKAEEMDIWGEHNWHSNLMAVLSIGLPKLMSKEQLLAVVRLRLPNYSQTEDCQMLIEYFYEKYTADKGFMSTTLREINAKAQRFAYENENQGEDENYDDNCNINYSARLPKMPMGVEDSINAVGPHLAMPVITAICPAIGALATGVELDVHRKQTNLNLIAYIAGDFGSGKGEIDPVINAWMSEVRATDKLYGMQEDEWRAKKRAAKNKKEQPEEIKFPKRFITLNNTVANISDRLANTEGKHAFSFTPEADTLAQKWRSTMSDFSVILRQSYDGTSYEREAKSVDAVNVHIDKVLWNITMCGTPDALYRVVNNYTDGFQSRIAVARTPDNTYARLEDKPYVLTDKQTERIQHVAHLLPLMTGKVELPKLETKGRTWVERIRQETMKNDDRTRARQRFRVCVTTQRMVCCLMLCRVCDTLIAKHGLNGAEKLLKMNPDLWKEMLLKAQTPSLLDAYDVIADYLLENALFFFRDKIEAAFNASNYTSTSMGERQKRGKNDTIYERLDVEFTFDQAYQQSVIEKGANTTRNAVQQMLKNWKKQQLAILLPDGRFRKLVI